MRFCRLLIKGSWLFRRVGKIHSFLVNPKKLVS